MLYVVPTPIGNLKDFTLRAIEVLKTVEIVIVEEKKVGERYLKFIGANPPRLEQLNEHSSSQDIERLVLLCKHHDCALISDAGTPNFCDPGARLIEKLRQNRITITALPGPSSLTTLLALVSEPLSSFYFQGFLPQENQTRRRVWQQLNQRSEAFIVMDTPYRLLKTLQEAQLYLGNERKVLLGINLSTPEEHIIEG
ncbi:MAG: SAM-dependent methyltransferase, partial [Bdellovibrionaceae bacterium]|nr:SAM-dependent methyltransferase [Pseudobdellovibrionaceae bacterium]MDW8190808.1 SAM-dependent methyltransferase [Pseudobdellovibrionaceae bacterium]